MSENIKNFDYDIALSFAGEDRAYVSQVADSLRKNHVKVFYDEYETANLWGKDLYEYLSEVYYKRAKFTVIFISKYYAQKLWTSHERKNAQARAFEEMGEYILPVRFDHTEIPSMLNTTGYIDVKNLLPSQLSDLILTKLGFSSSTNGEQTIVRITRERVPWIWGFRGPPLPIPISSKDQTPVEIFIDDIKYFSILGGEIQTIKLEPGKHYIYTTSVLNDYISGPQGSGGRRVYELKSETIGKRFAANKTYNFNITLNLDRFGPGGNLTIQEVFNLYIEKE